MIAGSLRSVLRRAGAGDSTMADIAFGGAVAGGVLLVPESSSGCECDFAIQTSLAFMHRRP